MLLVVPFDPCEMLPSVVCDPPKPAAHTLQCGSNTGLRGTALVIMPYASPSLPDCLRAVDAYAFASSSANGVAPACGVPLRPPTNGSSKVVRNWVMASKVVCCDPVPTS